MSLRTPAPTGPDAIYNGDGWDAYAHGTHCGTFPNSQDAWAAARAAAFTAQYVADNQPVSEHDQQIVRELLTPALTITHDSEFGAIDYVVGNVELTVDADCPTHRPTLAINGSADEVSIGNLRNLFALLASAPVQQLMGIAPAAPAIEVAPDICDDALDVDCGHTIATTYRHNAIEAYFPLAPDPTYPENVPTLYVNEWITLTVADAYRLLPPVTTLLHSSEVQQAWAAWQAQCEEQAAQPVPDSRIPELARSIINSIVANHPDDPQAQAAALRWLADRLAA